MTFYTGYSYDMANRIASIGYPSGTAVTYGSDAIGRVVAVNAPGSGFDGPVVSGVAYQPFGPPNALDHGNG